MLKRFIPFVFLAVASLATAGQTFSGRVVGVSDGDTIEVMHDGRGEKIRLHGIDCPESSQAFGAQAKATTSDLVFGKTVTVYSKEQDKYGRTVGEVLLPDGRSLNRVLVSAGMAWWYRDYAKGDFVLEGMEAEAKAAGVGLWSQSSPTPPWDFRHGGQSQVEALPTAPVPSAAPPQPPKFEKPQPAPESTVYITRTGGKYHRSGCRYLSKSMIPISLGDAKSRGYGPCSVCGPPH